MSSNASTTEITIASIWSSSRTRERRSSGNNSSNARTPAIKVYDETILVMKSAVRNARLGRDEEMQALKRLDDQARRLERTAQGPSLESFIATERAASPMLDGRSVFGWEKRTDATEVGDTRHLAEVDALCLNRTQAIGVGGLKRGQGECYRKKHATDRHSDLLWVAT
jgi:hypothetical protein